jgi:cell division protein FtsZ
MKEFEEIGEAVSTLASDDATVVIGTVIDPDIGDELRVTVVATGLGDSQTKRNPDEDFEQAFHVVRNGTTGQPEPGYAGEEALPTADNAAAESPDLFTPDGGIDYLDIPSFLRNQAD